MDIPTVALVVGISHYQSLSFPPLPGAASDAIRFARALKHWGVEEKNIFLFLNESATYDQLNIFFDSLSNMRERFNLVFYFCGHGIRTRGTIPRSYLILHDTKDDCVNGLPLDVIGEKLQSFNVAEVYLFVDACYLRMNHILNPNLREEMFGEDSVKRGFFCLLSSGIDASYEDIEENYGYFTDALLRAISLNRQTGMSASSMINWIRHSLKERDLSLPEAYNIDICAIQFLPRDLSSFKEGPRVCRPRLCAEVEDIVVQHRGKIVVIHGEPGLGKTILVQQLVSDRLSVYYFDAHVSDEMLSSIEKEEPAAIVIIDHVAEFERMSMLRKFSIGFILVSTSPCSEPYVYNWKMPSLIPTEAAMIDPTIDGTGWDVRYLMAKGNPSLITNGVKRVVDRSSVPIEKEIERAIAACSASRYIVDRRLFCSVFSIQKETFLFLEMIGILVRGYRGWVSVAFVDELVSFKKVVIDSATALLFLEQQFALFPKDRVVARYFVLSLISLSVSSTSSILEALMTLQTDEDTIFETAASIFLSKKVISEEALLLVEMLFYRNQIELAEKVLAMDVPVPQLDSHVRMMKGVLLWRVGKISEAGEVFTGVIDRLSERVLLPKLYYYRGNTFLLQGRFEEALDDFNCAYKMTKGGVLKGNLLSLLSVVHGFYHADLEKASKLVIKATQLLYRKKEYRGVQIAWNNLAEIYWRRGDYVAALGYIEKASRVPVISDDLTLQIKANLLQIKSRMGEEISVQDLEKALVRLKDLNLKIEIVHALVAASLFRGELKKPVQLLNMIDCESESVPFFHVYTLAYRSFVALLQGAEIEAQEKKDQALWLAKTTKNRLASQFIQRDFDSFSNYLAKRNSYADSPFSPS